MYGEGSGLRQAAALTKGTRCSNNKTDAVKRPFFIVILLSFGQCPEGGRPLGRYYNIKTLKFK